MDEVLGNNNILGKKVSYPSSYFPELLCPIDRALNRQNLTNLTHFYGYDVWNSYEISCLNENNKPMLYIGEIYYKANSPKIIESKSLKLYLNSLNNHVVPDGQDLASLIKNDLSTVLETEVIVKLYPLAEYSQEFFDPSSQYISLDRLDDKFEVTQNVEPKYLKNDENQIVKEKLYSNLLKSNCLITGQPDWGTIFITYEGDSILHKGLLQYILSYRHHDEFHEHCVERIFCDIWQYCSPIALTVYARYTRRGGIDINPYRSSKNSGELPPNIRLIRQ